MLPAACALSLLSLTPQPFPGAQFIAGDGYAPAHGKAWKADAVEKALELCLGKP